jgi:pimeloyl-[acyl-carrier protein] methyl ester esterase
VSLFRSSSGAGPDVALLHGWGLHGGLFEDLAHGLEANFRVHVLDLPGHGHSSWGKGDQDLEGVARRVAEHLPERCSLLGWSLGGMVAIRIARLFPERVPRLVLVSTSPRFLKSRDWPHGADEKTLTALATGLKRDWRGSINDFLSLQVRGDEHQLETLRALKSAAFAHGEPGLAALTAGLDILRAADLRPELAHIRARTLVIGGAYDRLTAPGAIEALAAGIAGARAVILPRAAHAPFLSHPEAFLALVTEFLQAP